MPIDKIIGQMYPVFGVVLITLPLLGIGEVLTLLDFNVLWRYFSWSNQTLAMIALYFCLVTLRGKSLKAR